VSNPSTFFNQERASIVEESSTPTPSEIKSTPENNNNLRIEKDRSSELKPYFERDDDDE
jgi:hypothetical protein